MKLVEERKGIQEALRAANRQRVSEVTKLRRDARGMLGKFRAERKEAAAALRRELRQDTSSLRRSMKKVLVGQKEGPKASEKSEEKKKSEERETKEKERHESEVIVGSSDEP